MLTVLRRVIVLLILTAYLSAVSGQHMPIASAMAGDMGTGIAHHEKGPNDKMPCKGTPQPCVADLGCVFLVSLPAISNPALLTLTAWASVLYSGTPDALAGRSVKPPLGPPIALA